MLEMNIVKSDLVSIIIPVYNVELFLDECLKSIESQTYKNLEILLVDDGSTDNSGKICQAHILSDNRIAYFKKENGGLSSARNYGINKANGKFLCFIDSDDFVGDKFVEHLINSFDDNTDIVISGIVKTEENGVIITSSEKTLENEKFESKQLISKSISDFGYQYICAVNRMYKKEVFDTIRFNNGKLHEDEFLLNKIVEKSFIIKTISEYDYFYRKTNGSIMNSLTSIKRLDACDAFLERSKIAERLKLRKEKNRCIYLSACILLQVLVGGDISSNVLKIMRYFFKCYRPFIIRSCTYKIPYYIIKSLIRSKRMDRRFAKIERSVNNERKKNGKCIFFVGTPIHGNLGDQAIVMAENKLVLNSCKVSRNIIEIDNELILFRFFLLRKIIKECDLLIIDGGGNLGSLWPAEDNKITKLVGDFNCNLIIIFPQTCFYDEFSDYRIIRSRRAYLNNPQLHIFLRDQASFDIFDSLYKDTKHYFSPDIVMSLSRYISNKKTYNKKRLILVCKRFDKESTLKRLPNYLDSKFYNKYRIQYFSTVLNKRIDAKTRNKELDKLFKRISKAELVITDRLHALLFSYINSTKCICFDNKSHKVFGALSWLNNKVVYPCNGIDDLKAIIDKALEYKPTKTDFEVVDSHKIIEEIIHGWENK